MQTGQHHLLHDCWAARQLSFLPVDAELAELDPALLDQIADAALLVGETAPAGLELDQDDPVVLELYAVDGGSEEPESTGGPKDKIR